MDLYLELTEGDEEAWFRIHFSIFSNTFTSFPGLRGTDLETRLKIRHFYILSFTATNAGHLLIDCWIESRNLQLFSAKSFGTSRYPVSWNFDLLQEFPCEEIQVLEGYLPFRLEYFPALTCPLRVLNFPQFLSPWTFPYANDGRKENCYTGELVRRSAHA